MDVVIAILALVISVMALLREVAVLVRALGKPRDEEEIRRCSPFAQIESAMKTTIGQLLEASQPSGKNRLQVTDRPVSLLVQVFCANLLAYLPTSASSSQAGCQGRRRTCRSRLWEKPLCN